MSGNRFLLSSVAFGVSFGLGLLLSRGDFGKAFGGGCLTFVASQVGAVVATRHTENQLIGRTEELRGHIRSLQRRRSEAYVDLLDVIEEHDRIIENIRTLQNQTKFLKAQNAINQGRSSSGFSWDLAAPSGRRSAPKLPTFNDELDDQLDSLAEQEEALHQAIAETLATKQHTELQLTTAQAELNQLQAQIAEQKASQTTLQDSIASLTQQRQQLEAHLTQLQAQITALEQYRDDLNQLISSADPKRQQVEAGSEALQRAIDQLQQQLASLHGELAQLEAQILQRRSQKESLDQELITLQRQREQLKDQLAEIDRPPPTQVSPPPPQPTPTSASLAPAAPDSPRDPAAPVTLDLSQAPLSKEWAAFIQDLPHYEFQALYTIAKHPNPGPSLKQIAEANLTMPELLIDAINERALESIGDLILETHPDSSQGTVIAQEYVGAVQDLIQAFEATQIDDPAS